METRCFSLFWGKVKKLCSKTIFGSPYVAEQILFSMSAPILCFNFDLIFWSLGPKWAIFRIGIRVKNVSMSTHIARQLLFPMLLSLLHFIFCLIFGHFWLFKAQMDSYLGWDMGQKLFLGLLV